MKNMTSNVIKIKANNLFKAFLYFCQTFTNAASCSLEVKLKVTTRCFFLHRESLQSHKMAFIHMGARKSI